MIKYLNFISSLKSPEEFDNSFFFSHTGHLHDIIIFEQGPKCHPSLLPNNQTEIAGPKTCVNKVVVLSDRSQFMNIIKASLLN